MANSIKWQYQISEFTGRSKLCRFFENVEQFLSAICAVTLRAADLLNDAQLLQLSDGAHSGLASSSFINSLRRTPAAQSTCDGNLAPSRRFGQVHPRLRCYGKISFRAITPLADSQSHQIAFYLCRNPTNRATFACHICQFETDLGPGLPPHPATFASCPSRCP